jgi:peptidoglycan hydrolase CwlO-like protein
MKIKELSENTGFNISIKTLIAISFAIAAFVGVWFKLQSDITEAKKLPKQIQDVSRMEFDMKDKNIRLSIEHIEETVDEIKENIKRLEDKIDKLR